MFCAKIVQVDINLVVVEFIVFKIVVKVVSKCIVLMFYCV